MGFSVSEAMRPYTEVCRPALTGRMDKGSQIGLFDTGNIDERVQAGCVGFEIQTPCKDSPVIACHIVASVKQGPGNVKDSPVLLKAPINVACNGADGLVKSLLVLDCSVARRSVPCHTHREGADQQHNQTLLVLAPPDRHEPPA